MKSVLAATIRVSHIVCLLIVISGVGVVFGSSASDSEFDARGGAAELSAVRFFQSAVNLVVSPSASSASVGVPFDILVNVQAGSLQLDGVEVNLDFDPTVLQVQSITVPVGSQLTFEALALYCNQPPVDLGCSELSSGQLHFAYGRTSGFATGTFPVAQIRVLPLAAAPSTEITFVNEFPRYTLVSNSNIGEIPSNPIPGSFAVIAPEPTPTVTIFSAPATVDEGLNGNITISRTGSTTNALTLTANVVLGTGMIEADYTLSGGAISPQSGNGVTFTIGAGSGSVNVNLAAVNDTIAEADNALTFQLVDGANYDLGATTNATITIPANDVGVINSNDAGDGSLRQAVLNANNLGGADEIIIPAGTYTLTSGSLGVLSDVTLTGSGTGSTTLNGNGGRALVITGGTVLLRRLTITGGGVDVSGGSVTIGNDPVYIVGNNTTVCGGGLHVGAGTVTVQAGSHINNNSTTGSGGGVCVDGTGALIVQDSGTQIDGNGASFGGGIYTAGASVTVQSGASVSGSTAGGGIYHEAGNLNVTGSYIQLNTGGAIRFAASGTRSVTNTCIVRNSDTAVTFAGGSGVIATGNWWGTSAGPFSGIDTPNPPNDANTIGSYGDSVLPSTDPAVFDYSGYLTSAPAGCYACTIASMMGGQDRDLRDCGFMP